MATFAAFGSFATLVLASFGGTRRDKLLAHVALALAGSVLLTIGTAVSSSTVLAALVTVPVTFAVFFAGIAGPNAASGRPARCSPTCCPAASSGTISMVPDRLAGWWLASVAGTAAVCSPHRRLGDNAAAPRGLRRSPRTLADVLDAALRGAADEDELAATRRGQAWTARAVHGDAVPADRPGRARPGAGQRRRAARVVRGTDHRRDPRASRSERCLAGHAPPAVDHRRRCCATRHRCSRAASPPRRRPARALPGRGGE